MTKTSIRRFRLLTALLLMSGCSPAVAQASETVKLKVAFSPNRVGASTTVKMNMAFANTNGGVPSPVTSFAMHLPPELELIGSSLGLAICNPTALLNRGLAGCSPNSRLGSGSAHVVVPFGPEMIGETASIQALMGPPPDEQIGVLLYAQATTPVSAELVFPGVLFIGSTPTGEILNTSIPPTPTLPGAPDASITSFNLAIGPNHLTYYEKVHGKMVGYRPQGITIPPNCPPGGFPFVAEMTFEDGSYLVVKAPAPCPPRDRRTDRKHSHSSSRARRE